MVHSDFVKSWRGHVLRARPGFTLIEVLVVVAIIALLVGTLLPSLSRARQQARATVCTTNIRQIASGWHLYAQQYNDAAVAGRPAKLATDPDSSTAAPSNLYFVGNGWKYRPRWFAMLGRQIGIYAYRKPSPRPADDNTQLVDGEIYQDPAASERISSRNYAYGYNFQFLGNSRTNSSKRYINWPVKTGRIPRLSETVMAADNLGTAATVPIAERLPYDQTGTSANTDPARIGNHAWALDPPRLTAQGDFCDDGLRGKYRSAVDPRHLGRANAAFCDGHVERLLPAQLGYVVNPDGSVPLTDQGTNRLFSGNGKDLDPPPVQ